MLRKADHEHAMWSVLNWRLGLAAQALVMR